MNPNSNTACIYVPLCIFVCFLLLNCITYVNMSKMDVDIDYDLGFNHELEDRCEYVGTDTPPPRLRINHPASV